MTNGRCTVCPKKCTWDKHLNASYKYEEYTYEETITNEDLKKAYTDATSALSDYE